MKFIRTLFQITAFLLIVFFHPLRANTSDTLLKMDIRVAPSAAVTKSNPAHQSASRILAGLETGFMGDIVPLAALFLFGRAVWLVIPPLAAESNTAQRPDSGTLKTGLRDDKGSLALPGFARTIWQALLSPRIEAEVAEEWPAVEVPPLRPTPGRITIF